MRVLCFTGHVVERSRNTRTGHQDEKQDYININQSKSASFSLFFVTVSWLLMNSLLSWGVWKISISSRLSYWVDQRPVLDILNHTDFEWSRPISWNFTALFADDAEAFNSEWRGKAEPHFGRRALNGENGERARRAERRGLEAPRHADKREERRKGREGGSRHVTLRNTPDVRSKPRRD